MEPDVSAQPMTRREVIRESTFRRDNLAVAVMVVESIFWFHPLVWWLEKRLVDERERACDEEVIRLGREPQLYAESILKICEFCVGSPSIVAGVTGSDLKKRVEAIMRNDVRATLKFWRKCLLAATAVMAVGAPIAIGVLDASRLEAQQSSQATASSPAFEVASVRRNTGGARGRSVQTQPGGRFMITNIPARTIIRIAYAEGQNMELRGVISILMQCSN